MAPVVMSPLTQITDDSQRNAGILDNNYQEIHVTFADTDICNKYRNFLTVVVLVPFDAGKCLLRCRFMLVVFYF